MFGRPSNRPEHVFRESAAASTLLDSDPEEFVGPSLDMEMAGDAAGKTAGRRLSIYEPFAVFSLVDELAHLSRRAIEPNVFFDPAFLAPAMPRLEDRAVRLMVVRDDDGRRSRLRLLMPFSVERRSILGAAPLIRAWSHPFGPLGTLLIDGDDPVGVMTEFLDTLAAAHSILPPVLVLPNIVADGAMAATLTAAAERRGLPLERIQTTERAALKPRDMASPSGSSPGLGGHTARELRRLERVLARHGRVRLEIASRPDAVRLAFEDFLMLEASGWKGRRRSALVLDRYRSAFAREAINNLAVSGRVRVFTLLAGDVPAAALIVLIDRGTAYAWKTAYDERFAKASPGQQVVAGATAALRADPAVERADSCTVPDHFVMNRFWPSRRTVTTAVVGLRPDLGERVASTARHLATLHRSRNLIRITRERLASFWNLG